jgi:hypothetical protein
VALLLILKVHRQVTRYYETKQYFLLYLQVNGKKMFISRSQVNVFRLGLVARTILAGRNDFVYERRDVMAIEIVASRLTSRLHVAHLVAIR